MPFAERLVELMRASNAPDGTRIVAHGASLGPTATASGEREGERGWRVETDTMGEVRVPADKLWGGADAAVAAEF